MFTLKPSTFENFTFQTRKIMEYTSLFMKDLWSSFQMGISNNPMLRAFKNLVSISGPTSIVWTPKGWRVFKPFGRVRLRHRSNNNYVRELW